MKNTGVTKKLLLEQLRKSPIIEAACQKIGISRMTFYRWKEQSKTFAKEIDQALLDGRLLVNDLAESQLISAVKDKNISAIMHWLRHNHPTYANTLQIKHAIEDESLSPEQERLVRKALALAAWSDLTLKQTQVDEKAAHHPTKDGERDGQGSKGPRRHN